MKQKTRYIAPAVRRVMPIRLNGTLLSGSVVDHIDVTSVGQEVDNFDYDFSGNTDGFNHEWN